MLVIPNKNCFHINTQNLFPLSEFSYIPFHLLKCENCEENCELWICITCGKSFCGRYKNNHCYLHYISNNQKDHNICISFLDFSIWCYQCENNFFSDKGNYITNTLCQKYIDILAQFKFSINYNPSIYDIFNSMDLSKNHIKDIKYHNFIELLKNNKLNKITFLVGAGISTSSGIPDFRGSNGVFIDIIKKYNLQRAEEFFSKKNFLEKPELLYDYLKQFKSKEYFPNITHYFMKYLIDKKKCELIFTQNFDGLEIKAGIDPNNILFAHGTLTEGHCISCGDNVDINLINKGINDNKIIKCEKCGGPCKPKIVLYNEDLPEIFYEKADYAKECDVGIIIGTELVVDPFSRLTNKFNKNAWIVIINKTFVGDFDCYNIFNKQLFLEGYCDDIIKQILIDCGWLDDFQNKYSIKK
jgi:NAD-dependent histone deacetylase SIR2